MDARNPLRPLRGWLLLFLLLLTACGTQKPTSPLTDNMTPAEVLKKSAQVMKEATSLHFELEAHSIIQIQNFSNPVIFSPNTSGIPSEYQPGVMDVKGQGDTMYPDRQQVQLTINEASPTASIRDGEQMYVRPLQGQWYVLPYTLYQQAHNNPFAYLLLDGREIVNFLQHQGLADHKSELLDGRSNRHISSSFDRYSFPSLLQAFPGIKKNLGLSEVSIEYALKHLERFNTSLDIWIDEETFTVTSYRLQVDFYAEISANEGNAPARVITTLQNTVNYNRYNQQVTINPPANATKLNNTDLIFGDGHP